MARKLAPIGSTDVRSATATVHGRSVSYREAGSGKICCCSLHGMAGTAGELALGDRAAGPAQRRRRA